MAVDQVQSLSHIVGPVNKVLMSPDRNSCFQLQKRGDELHERNEKLEEEICRMRQLLKDAEEEIRQQDQRLVVSRSARERYH